MNIVISILKVINTKIVTGNWYNKCSQINLLTTKSTFYSDRGLIHN